jgi:hypothetical protein
MNLLGNHPSVATVVSVVNDKVSTDATAAT